jgi:hypothetical protein
LLDKVAFLSQTDSKPILFLRRKKVLERSTQALLEEIQDTTISQ